jgi:energy-converting hydrogenase Eha subunit E
MFSNGDLDPKVSKYNTNLGLHISLLYTKFDYNISFLTLIIVTVTLTLTLGGPNAKPTGVFI